MKVRQPVAASIDEYIASCPAEIQPRLQKLRAIIQKAAPGATEKISYQIPTFALHGNLVHFAACKHHIGFYPGASGIRNFQGELATYHFAKGSVQFPLDQSIPWQLVSRIVQFRAKENLDKAASRHKNK